MTVFVTICNLTKEIQTRGTLYVSDPSLLNVGMARQCEVLLILACFLSKLEKYRQEKNQKSKVEK